MTPAPDPAEPSVTTWPHALDDAARDLIAALRWQLYRIRLKTLDPEGYEARRGVWSARTRVFTLLSGMPQGGPIVIDRAVQLGAASDGKTPPPPKDSAGNAVAAATQAPIDNALQKSIKQWRDLDQGAFWDAVGAYVTAAKANLAEQIMLLTYFEAIFPIDPAADPDADLTNTPAKGEPVDVGDLTAALSLVCTSDDPQVIYKSIGNLLIRGAQPSNAFTTQVGLLALASLVAPEQLDT